MGTESLKPIFTGQRSSIRDCSSNAVVANPYRVSLLWPRAVGSRVEGVIIIGRKYPESAAAKRFSAQSRAASGGDALEGKVCLNLLIPSLC